MFNLLKKTLLTFAGQQKTADKLIGTYLPFLFLHLPAGRLKGEPALHFSNLADPCLQINLEKSSPVLWRSVVDDIAGMLLKLY